MAYLVPFTRENKHHQKIVNTLTRRNNFYQANIQNFINNNPTAGVALLCEGSKVCGFVIWLQVIGAKYQNKVVVNINYLLIDKDYRGKGYGRKLASCITSSIPNILLTALNATRESAIFWVKMGFWFGNHAKYPKTEQERQMHIDTWEKYPYLWNTLVEMCIDNTECGGHIPMVKEGKMPFKEIYYNLKKAAAEM